LFKDLAKRMMDVGVLIFCFVGVVRSHSYMMHVEGLIEEP
jgi:hypothetical protein